MVTVVDFRYENRASTDQAAPLTEQVAQALRDVSGRPWTIDAYLTPDTRPPMRGTRPELKAILDAYDLWHKGHVWLFGDGTLATFEQYWILPGKIELWGDVSTDNIDVAAIPAPLVVHCFNCERGVAEACHSVVHTAERIFDKLDHAAYTAYVGREADPWTSYRTPVDQPVVAYPGGHGTCHLCPGATRQYDYSGYPGGQESFLRWWLSGLPAAVWDELRA